MVFERPARRDDQVDTRKYDSRSKVLVFKTQYGSHIKALSIKKEISKLYNMLKQHMGRSFLQDTRTVIAHIPQAQMLLCGVIRLALYHLPVQRNGEIGVGQVFNVHRI